MEKTARTGPSCLNLEPGGGWTTTTAGKGYPPIPHYMTPIPSNLEHDNGET